jgi:hypothetical protein
MDFAGASGILHAARRLSGVAALVALLALAFVTTAAHAQVASPPDAAPGQTAPDQSVDPDWDHNGDDWDHHDDDWDWPDDTGGQQPQQPQRPGGGTGAFPAEPGGDEGWNRPEEEELPTVTTSYVAGAVARMRTDGKAAIPLGAPKRVRALIGQYNRIVGKRYKWGGGHAKLVDTGYDCSGAVGYGLIKGGLLNTTMVSGSFARWGAAGSGRWVTVYAAKGHVYTEVAGLRLDTSSVGDRGGRSGVRWRPAIGERRGFTVRHPVGL